MAGWSYTDVPQLRPAIDSEGKMIGVPLVYEKGPRKGEQKIRRYWTWSWRHLHHVYGTLGVTPVDGGGFGLSIKDVADCMGHRSTETTLRHYVDSREGIGARIAHNTAASSPDLDPRPPLRVVK